MMSWINRRELFAAAGGVFAAWLTRRRAAAAAAIPPAPVARVAVVKDTYFGETLSDPYRWMENDKDPGWLPFLRGQNEHTRAVLNTIRGRDRLLQRIQQLSGDAAATLLVQRAGGRLFYQQRPAGADNFKLFVREDGGASRVLIDPTLLSSATSHLSLDWWRASPDGSHVVYGVSKDGSEDSILHVLGVADGRELPERIANTEDANPQWLADASGFFYNQLTGAVDTPERYLDSQARFHKLGADPESDPILMKRGLDPRVQYERIQMPYVVVHEGSRHALLLLADVREETRVFIAPVADAAANRAQWTAVAGFEDEITDTAIDGDTLYLLANKGHPRGRILRTATSAPSVASASEVVPEGSMVIHGIARARDGLYLHMIDGGLGKLRRLTRCSGRGHHAALRRHPHGAGGDGERGRRAVLLHRLAHRGGYLERRRARPGRAHGTDSQTADRRQSLRDDALHGQGPGRYADSLLAHLQEGTEARRQHAGVDFGLRFLWYQRLYAGVRGTDPGADRRGFHRRLRQRARRWRIRPRLAQGRAAGEQAQHLARPDRCV